MARTRIDWAAIDDAVRAANGVLTHTQLKELGLSSSTITRWIGPRGRWQRLLPGVVLAHRGTPTRHELLLGALAFAGHGAVVTGSDALRAHGAPAPVDRRVRVLVPMARQRKSFDYVQVERTRRMPAGLIRNGIPYAPVSRAAVDACRGEVRLDDVREVMAGIVQRGKCPVTELRREVLGAARQRTALSRMVLLEVSAGIRSVAEAKAREVMRRLGLPTPLWNVRLIRADGSTICTPDAYWPHVAAALEIDSLAWHLSPASYRRTKRRERLLTETGIMVISFTPTEILQDPEAFAAELRTFLAQAARRPLPAGITAVPNAS